MTVEEPTRARRDPGPLLASGLLVIAASRAVAVLAPAGFVWGVGAARDVNPALGMAFLGLGIAGGLFGLLAGPPDRLLPIADGLRRGWPFAIAAAFTMLLIAFPDRVRFVGDFVLRLGTLESATGFEHIFPQTLPFDRLLNHVLPVRLGALLGLEPLVVLRAMGVLELWLLVAIAARFGGLVSTRASTASVVAVVLSAAGVTTLLTGYSKPTPQLILCVLATATLGVEQVMRGSGRVLFALAVSAGLALHRGGLPLLLPWAVASVLTLRRHGLGASSAPGTRRMSGKSALNAIAIALPLVVLALEARALVSVITTFDAPVNFLPAEVRTQGGVLAAAFAPVRLVDDANALLFHAPLAPLVLLGGLAAWRARERWALASVAVAFLPVLLFVHLPLGPFRDFDSLGGVGAALAVASAWTVAEVLDRSARRPALALAVIAVAASTFLATLISFTDLERGIRHAEAIVAGPPARSASQRASALDWLGLRALNEDRYDTARDAYRRLCLETPIPHALKLWGASSLVAERPDEAQQAFARLLEGSPEDPVGWYGLWMSATLNGDTLAARRAAEHTRPWATESREMSEVVEFFDHYPRLYAILRRTLPPR